MIQIGTKLSTFEYRQLYVLGRQRPEFDVRLVVASEEIFRKVYHCKQLIIMRET